MIEDLFRLGLLREAKYRKELAARESTSRRKRLAQFTRRALGSLRVARSKIDRHVVICAMPRSGSTLLLMMMRACLRDAFVPEAEVAALEAVGTRRHVARTLVTKRPNDIYWIDEIVEVSTSRNEVRFVITTRDPREVLVSRMGEARREYYVETARLKELLAVLSHYRTRYENLMSFVDYRDIVEAPDALGERMARLTGCTLDGDFGDFHSRIGEVTAEASLRALGGVRSPDTASVGSWNRPEHHARIREVLQDWPELCSCLVELGYESDDAWAEDFR